LQFPKKKPRLIEDLTLILQKEFIKRFTKINRMLGNTLIYPYTILIDKSLQVMNNSTFGCKRIDKKIYVPSRFKDSGVLEHFVLMEWFYTFVSTTINVLPGESHNKMRTEFSALLTRIYNNTEGSSPTRVRIGLKKYLLILIYLRKYEVSLSQTELGFLIDMTNEFFISKRYLKEDEFNPEFLYFNLFSRASKIEQNKDLNSRAIFLARLFNLLISPHLEHNLYETIEFIKDFLKYSYIQNYVKRINKLISTILTEYIITFLKLDTYTSRKNAVLDVVVRVYNNSNQVLEDFSSELMWNPEKCLATIEDKDLTKYQDLHVDVTYKYYLKIHQDRTIKFSSRISFTNPVFKEKRISKTIFLKELET